MKIFKKLPKKLQSAFLFLPALKLVWHSDPKLTIIRILLVITQGILPLASIYLTKLIIDTLTINLGKENATDIFNQLLPLLILGAIVTIFITFCQSLNELINSAHSRKVTDYMQDIIQTKSIAADLEYYENAKYHNTLQRAQSEAAYRPPQILNRLAQTAQNGISLLAMIGLLISLHWGIIGVLLVAAIPASLVKIKFSRLFYNWQRSKTESERRSMYLNYLLTAEPYAKEIRLFNLGSLFRQWYSEIRKNIYRESLAIFTKRSIYYFLAQVFAGLLIFATFILIIYQTTQGLLLIGDLFLYQQALQRGQDNIKGLLNSLSGLYEDNLFLSNLYEFLNIKPQIINPTFSETIPNSLNLGITFESVSFSYSDSSRQALEDIDLQIKPGETIALVGENGSGKTTLIKLLCRLYDPTAGSIKIDGIDIRNFKVEELRSKISVIFQDYAKYHLAASENIRLGNIKVPPKHQKIQTAALHSGADDVIQKLPQKYDTVLGKFFSFGEELSIGQWQKVALARAFLRESQVIVLDEPTSAMDPKAEYEVFKQFQKLIKNQAAILITHRLSTVRMADRIYVMNNGRIVESGSHQELIQQQGTYAHLFEIQAKNYRL